MIWGPYGELTTWGCKAYERWQGAGHAGMVGEPKKKGPLAEGGSVRVLRPPLFASGTVLGTLPTPDRLAALGLKEVAMEVGGGPGTVVALVGGGGAESATSHGSSVAVTAPVGGKGKGKEGEKVESAAEPFLLSEGLPPVPAKLVAKIRKGKFVDMADLLRDNIEASRRQAESEQPRCGGEGKKARREIPDFLSWLECFGVYASVVANQQPERFKELMAYQTIMIREARRCGGSGWLAYDSTFRQHAANARGTDWAKLNTSLYTVTFMQQHNGRGRTC